MLLLIYCVEVDYNRARLGHISIFVLYTNYMQQRNNNIN